LDLFLPTNGSGLTIVEEAKKMEFLIPGLSFSSNGLPKKKKLQG
jgi:hypothetical protein